MPIDVGTQVQDFTVLKATGDKVEAFKLSENLGKQALVLAFFPLAFTGVCTTEMCTFRDSIAAFNDLKGSVYGVSVDSPFTQNQFIAKEKLNFPMLSDFNRELVSAFGVKREQPIGPPPGLLGVANRSVFVLDKGGKVAYRWFSDNPKDLPPFDEVKAALAKLN
ncbi:MAG TPA: redoxin domain-containing protein [Planctomycetota bacterium]|nr:redoxin domain-containing protein [Planctomycetota bacterium]